MSGTSGNEEEMAEEAEGEAGTWQGTCSAPLALLLGCGRGTVHGLSGAARVSTPPKACHPKVTPR